MILTDRYLSMDVSRYGIIGDGRLARHIARYLSLLGIPYSQWSRRRGGDPLPLLSGCRVALLLISDDAIEPFIRERLDGFPGALVHCAGSLSTGLAQGFHPLMAFGPALLGLEEYRAIPFISERGTRPFPEVFPELRNPHYEIPRGAGSLYHGLCVLGGNGTVLLWQKLFREFQDRLHLPAEVALPYLRQVCRSIETAPATALTGPLQREDRATIARDLAALAGDPFAKVYESFVRASRSSR